MSKEKSIQDILESATEEGRTNLTEFESKQILRACEIPTTKTELVNSKLEAIRAARTIKYPVVAKITSPDILHKSDIDGVRVGLASEIEVRHAFDDVMASAKAQFPDADIWGVTIQEFIPQEKEVIIGVTQDPSFGPTIIFGLGGIWVETLEDVSFRLPPISIEEAEKMIEEINGYPILAGARGGKPADIETLADIIQKIGDLVMEYEQISEIDLNPVFAQKEGEGATAVDARIMLKDTKDDSEED
ncbi:MAG: acetate--CoA ligase family protein [Hadesarchaea archaeon]|nr:acetate--CoA ligase family protein [Hadesarchaea archaeon]